MNEYELKIDVTVELPDHIDAALLAALVTDTLAEFADTYGGHIGGEVKVTLTAVIDDGELDYGTPS